MSKFLLRFSIAVILNVYKQLFVHYVIVQEGTTYSPWAANSPWATYSPWATNSPWATYSAWVTYSPFGPRVPVLSFEWTYLT